MEQPLTMEITIISAQGLKQTSSSLFSQHLKPFITLSTLPSQSSRPETNETHSTKVYKTRVDEEGGINPRWNEKFHVPIDPTFFQQRNSCMYLELYTKRFLKGQVLLGWCQIPAGDIMEAYETMGTVRRLSYRLRERDGSRGHGVVDIAVKLEGSVPTPPVVVRPARPIVSGMGQYCQSQTVIGIPVAMAKTSVDQP